MMVWRTVLGALAAFSLVLSGGCEAPAERVQTDAELQEEARLSILSNQTIGPVFQRLEVYYPDDVQAMLNETLAIHRRGGGQEEAATVVRTTIARILDREAAHASRADSSALREIAQTTLSLFQVLQREDVAACEEMLVTGNLSPQTRQRVSAAVHQALANGTVATIDAIQSGKSASRSYAAITPADYQALFAHSWANDVTRTNLRTLMTADRGALSQEVACQTGVLMWSDVVAARGDLTERYISEIMAP